MALDMRTGNPTKLMLKFTLPMFIGNLFQQLYTMVDSIIVGRFIGKDALASVGASFAFMNFLTLMIVGLSIGSSIVISHHYGADDYVKMKRSISTSIIFIVLLTIILSVVTFIFTRPLLLIIKTPAEILGDAEDYLRIIFAGLIFISLFNMSAALLRSVGDSKTPLYFLIIASVINIVLDLVFIINFDMGVKGAAYATIIAQAVAAILGIIYAFSKIPILKMKREEFIFDNSLFSNIAKYSILSSLQQSIMALGMVAVQGRVNSFGSDVIAAYTAAVKIDSLAYLPVQDFGNAFSTYIAQNVGAGKIDRIKQGVSSSVKIIVVFCILLSIIIITFSSQLMTMFVDPSEVKVIQTGVDYISVVGIFYILIGFLFMFYGFFRGIGSLMMTVILTIVSLGTRVILAFSLSSIPSIAEKGIWWSIPIGWVLADILGAVVYKKGKWQKYLSMYVKEK